jgi:nondiscriminating aspartyl-tRNA synthetase
MERTLAIETPQKVGQEVLLQGWVNTRRDHGKIIFIDLRDRSGLVQVVFARLADDKSRQVEMEDLPAGRQGAKELRPEWVVAVRGVIKERPANLVNPKLPTGTVEVEAKELRVLAKAAELPFDTGAAELKVGLPTLLDFRSLSLRHPKVRAIFKVQETIIIAFRESLKEQGFTEIQVPTIVSSTTEGGAQVFKIKYFDRDAFLAQSPQLYKQIMVGVFERVFTLAHAYRAEPSVTTRHITEYLGLDAEMGFINSFEEIMETVERVLRDVFSKVQEENQTELDLFGATLPKLSDRIPRMKMREAQQIIFERTGRDHRQEPDLEPEDEREICRFAEEKYGSELIFVTHYPTKKRPFYTYPDPKDPEFTYSFDLLGRGLEWVTGGQRINDYGMLLEQVKEWGNKPEDFEIYLQAFKYGMPPEGGFCLGAERMTMQLLGLENIREASLFPRDMERIDMRLPKKVVKKAK